MNSKVTKDNHLSNDVCIINGKFRNAVRDEKNTAVILEQWKTAVDCSKEISSRRLSMNGLFLTGLSILIGGITFGNGLGDFTLFQRVLVILTICIMGIVLCLLWINQLSYYSSLNEVKYSIIRELENYLPALAFQTEYTLFYGQGKSFSRIEKNLPWSFVAIFIIVILVVVVPDIIMLIGSIE